MIYIICLFFPSWHFSLFRNIFISEFCFSYYIKFITFCRHFLQTFSILLFFFVPKSNKKRLFLLKIAFHKLCNFSTENIYSASMSLFCRLGFRCRLGFCCRLGFRCCLRFRCRLGFHCRGVNDYLRCIYIQVVTHVLISFS